MSCWTSRNPCAVSAGTSTTPPIRSETVCSCYEMPACHGAVPATGCCDTAQIASSGQEPGYCWAPSHCKAPSAAEPRSVTSPTIITLLPYHGDTQFLQKQGSLQLFQLRLCKDLISACKSHLHPPVSCMDCMVLMAWSGPQFQSCLRSYQI